VLFMWPYDFTYVCPTEIVAFSDAYEKFKDINCDVVGCSTDSEFCHQAWTEKPRKEGGLGSMKFPLLADTSHKIAKDYGILLDAGVALRGLFIISDKGILRHTTINDLQVGRSVDETLRLVQAFQYCDAHGEVCPMGWKTSSKAIKPDPKGAKVLH
jgi:alkyl hydroperoxide reductase subunit AhpC